MARARAPKKVVPSARSVLDDAREVLETEALAIRNVATRLGPSFERAVDLVVACHGRIVVTGMGKAGIIAQKLSATFASTGSPSLYLHPAEALHGDLGRVTADDVVVALSNSGETEEIIRLLPALQRLGTPIITLTGMAESSIARASVAVLDIGNVEEACPMGLAPTTSAAALLALGDALAMSVLRRRPFTQQDYALIHPGGKLGRRLRKVAEVMRDGVRNPIVKADASVGEALAVMTKTPGRPGAASVVDGLGRLVGIFTDGDLRRLVQSGGVDFEATVESVMRKGARTVKPEMNALEAAQILRDFEIDQVPVVDAKGRPVGLLDVQDLLAARLLEG